MIIICIGYAVSTLIFFLPALKSGRNLGLHSRTKLQYVNNPLNSLSPDFLMKSAWVSTAMALILSVPPLGLFLTVFETSGNYLIGIAIGFGLHFVLLALSTRTSEALSVFFGD